jgi:peptidoglycan/LPS O-acetylase OafA/YrhL
MGVFRLLLAICVFCGHSRPLAHLHWLSGDLAVQLFFVISGFYMQLVLCTKYTKSKLGNSWWYRFYTARYLRLLPIYLAAFFIIIGVAAIWPTFDPVPVWRYAWDMPNTVTNVLFKIFLFVTNVTMFFQDAMMFLSTSGGHISWSGDYNHSEVVLWHGLAIPPAWSLGVELSFYILVPYLLNLRSRWLLVGSCSSLIIKTIAIRALHLENDPWNYRFFPFEIGNFLMGALAYRYRSSLEQIAPESIHKIITYTVAVAVTTFNIPVRLPTLVYPLALACVLPVMFRATASLRTDRIIGELSYPFYIFHFFALAVSASVSGHLFPSSGHLLVWMALGLTLCASAIALALELRFVEPWRVQLSDGRRKPRPRPSLVLVNPEPAGMSRAAPAKGGG